MSVLICGSFTYDTVMVLNDKFKFLNASIESSSGDFFYVIPDLRRQFGGCAGNIAYNLKMLGGDPLPMATIGMDFGQYAEWLDSQGISRTCIHPIAHSYTAQNFVTIDMEDNRITAFYAGAMAFSNFNPIAGKTHKVALATISLDNSEAMKVHALQLSEAGVPFLFDPGHAITEFDSNDLLSFVEQTRWVLLNAQQWAYMSKTTNLTAEDVASRVQALIITQGEKGAVIYAEGAKYQIPAAKAQAVNDTSTCGDAFCAGILYGLSKDIDWETTGRIAALMGAIKAEHHGSQTHRFTLEAFKARFKKNFGYALIV
ncbi:carbohydrate kinase family protein [Thioflexithrix psekupsensis]|uniref:Carbohydrate kinase family protein n=1 Tax=Thioflexithrix psekupsensis TaxID=1570016 RepID=A0A251X469_9GAMM|nr:carbohydrate kinase family protein [Thioflexithrix psekupsensis]OUD12293.1 carbohydrate kinase family protein [Thioflexithrix psekupsensis]